VPQNARLTLLALGPASSIPHCRLRCTREHAACSINAACSMQSAACMQHWPSGRGRAPAAVAATRHCPAAGGCSHRRSLQPQSHQPPAVAPATHHPTIPPSPQPPTVPPATVQPASSQQPPSSQPAPTSHPPSHQPLPPATHRVPAISTAI
jgi:hypothetical protein